MSIVCLISCMGPGGAERQLTGLAALLKDQGHEVQVCWFDSRTFYRPFLEEKGVPWKMLRARWKIVRVLKLRAELRRFRPDAVIAWLDGATRAACTLKALGAPWRLIVGERNTTQALTRKEKAKFRRYRVADAIVCNAATQADFVRTHFPQLAAKCSVIHNYVDLQAFKPSAGERPDGPVRLAVVARLHPQKNAPAFVEAVRLAREQGAALEVDWYGAPAEEERGGVRFHPPVQDVAAVYHNSDALCLPSLYEGFPNVVGEALACGLPVLCSRVCDNPLLVSDGVEGLLFDPTQPQDMADTILRFCALSPEELQTMGLAARHKAEAMLAPEAFVQRYLELLK